MLSTLETLSTVSKLDLQLSNSSSLASAAWILFIVYLRSDSSCEVPRLNAKHLWNMGHFVVQVDLPWILYSLRLVIMISMFYYSTDF